MDQGHNDQGSIMEKTFLILRFFATLSLLFFGSNSAFSGALVIDVPSDPQPTEQIIVYQCSSGTDKETIEATYLNAGNIELIDFRWKGERIIGSSVVSTSGKKYTGGQYIWWNNKDNVILYDLINDPKKEKPILCKDESTLLF